MGQQTRDKQKLSIKKSIWGGMLHVVTLEKVVHTNMQLSNGTSKWGKKANFLERKLIPRNGSSY